MTDNPLAETTLDIKHWGNSLGVRLPAAVARAAKLKADQRVRMTVEYGKVIIEPIDKSRMTLAERLAAYDVDRHGGEAMAVSPAGAERW